MQPGKYVVQLLKLTSDCFCTWFLLPKLEEWGETYRDSLPSCPFQVFQEGKKEWEVRVTFSDAPGEGRQGVGWQQAALSSHANDDCPGAGTRGAFCLLNIKFLRTRRQENKQDTVRIGFLFNISKI